MKKLPSVAGTEYIELDNWKEFASYLDTIKESNEYIWRGQSNSEWNLDTSFYRLLKDTDNLGGNLERLASEQLCRFKNIARGRIKYDIICDKDDNEMWALAQHYGMATKLLDWTYSPFVALFFAVHNHVGEERKISVWGVGKLEELNNRDGIYLESIRKFNPKQKKNPRLISQNALFTISPLGISVNKWIETLIPPNPYYTYLYKIDINLSSKDIDECLMSLNRMNINYCTLFPDTEGVAKFCNMAFKIPGYHNF